MALVALTICLAGCVAALGSEESTSDKEPKEAFYSQLTRAIVRLEEHRSLCTPGMDWAREVDASVGSAFFVIDYLEGEYVHFIVTARHVVEKHADLFARVRMGPESNQTAVLVLPRNLWAFHPTAPAGDEKPIDVAVMRIETTQFLKGFRNCPSEGKDDACGKSTRTGEPYQDQLADESPGVMERAIFFGFPGGDAASGATEPFVRAGVVAYDAPNPKLRRIVPPESVFYIDAPSFPGNSGGPVLRERLPLRDGVHLWGLVTGGSSVGRDYAIITRPEVISETLAYARETAILNKGAWSTELPRLPLKCVPDLEESQPN